MKAILLSSILVIVLASCFLQGSAAPLDEGTDCNCMITANIFYVCGSNGVTYINPSALNCAARCSKQTITVLHYGECK